MTGDHPDLVRWAGHRKSCRACTRRLIGGNRIEETPCPEGYPLFRASVAAEDSIEVDRRITKARRREEW